MEKIILSSIHNQDTVSPQEMFGLLTLGVLESLSSGLVSAADTIQTFFHAENCLYVRQQFGDGSSDEIMGRGVQLPDLFEILPTNVAQREFQSELNKMRSLCLSLLQQTLVAA